MFIGAIGGGADGNGSMLACGGVTEEDDSSAGGGVGVIGGILCSTLVVLATLESLAMRYACPVGGGGRGIAGGGGTAGVAGGGGVCEGDSGVGDIEGFGRGSGPYSARRSAECCMVRGKAAVVRDMKQRRREPGQDNHQPARAAQPQRRLRSGRRTTGVSLPVRAHRPSHSSRGRAPRAPVLRPASAPRRSQGGQCHGARAQRTPTAGPSRAPTTPGGGSQAAPWHM